MTTGTALLGLLNGMNIALLAVGFVLIYRANRFLNMASAQLGVFATVLFIKITYDIGMNWWLAFGLAMIVGIGTGLLVEAAIVGPARRRTKSPVRLMILTIGVSQILLATTFLPGLTATSTSGVIPEPFSASVEIGGVVLGSLSILTLFVVPVVLIALAVFLGYSALGKRIRAAAGNPDAARLCGISVSRVSLITWGIAGGLSTLAAILGGSSATAFNASSTGPYLLMLTMGAAAFGAFVSFPIAIVGGLGIGMLYQLVLGKTSNASTAELTVFAAILLIILVRGRAIAQAFDAQGAAVPERPGLRVPEILRGSMQQRNATRVLVLVSLAVAVAIPLLPFFKSNQFALVLVLVYVLVGVALTILVGWAGQISLGHFALVGIGAYLTARWAGHAGWSLIPLLLATGLAGAAVMVVIGLPALRVRGLALAVPTLALAVIAPDWLYLQHWVGGDTPFDEPVDLVKILPGFGTIDSQISLYYVVLAILVLVLAAVSTLRRSAIGRVIIAVRDNERASSSFGINPLLVKVRTLGLSGFIAGTTGVVFALNYQQVTPLQFGADISIAILSIPVIGGLGSLGGAVAAGVILYGSTYFIGPHVAGLLGSFGNNEGFLLFLGGFGTIATMLQYPSGIAGGVQNVWQRHLNRKAARLEAATAQDSSILSATAEPAGTNEVGTPGSITNSLAALKSHGSIGRSSSRRSAATDSTVMPLVVRGVSLRFGGVTALNNASIEVRPGEIAGLIGPNGAGKTTLMNIISGVLKPSSGSVQVFGHELAGKPPELRARYGLARSFQDATLFAGLTVLETVQVALSRRTKTYLLPAMLGAPWVRAADRQNRAHALSIVEALGLGPWADALTSELSTGMRRICDLAAQVATEPRLLLLDEPTAGVAQREAEAFGPLVRRLRDELGCAILVIEHDMPLLMGLCDRVYALDAGAVIAEGSPLEIRANPDVIASYLGTNTVAIARSGRQSPALG